MIVKNVRCVASAVPGIVLMASLAVLTTACSNGGTDAAGSTSPPATSAAPVDTSTAPATAVPATTGPAASAVPSITSSPAPQPTPSSSATVTSCATIAATRKFLYLNKATINPDGSLVVTGTTATMVCGGPDDFHFTFGTATITGHVLSSATLQVVGTSQGATPLTLAKFPLYLETDYNTRVFVVTGPLAGITGLAEQFHP